MYLPSVVMVGFYFDKNRAMATGIAVCGSGIGTFILAPIVNLLVSEYGWKVSFPAKEFNGKRQIFYIVFNCLSENVVTRKHSRSVYCIISAEFEKSCIWNKPLIYEVFQKTMTFL